MSLGYDSGHGPHQVFASVVVIAVSDIDTAKQSFHCRFVLTLEWQDGSVVGPPKPVLPNAISFEIGEPSYDRSPYHQMGWIKSTMAIAGTFSEAMELENFPFDCQDLQLVLEWPSAVEEQEMQVRPSFGSSFVTVDAKKIVMSEWRLRFPIAEFKYDAGETIGENTQVLLIRFNFSRVASTYLCQIFLIMSLICACSLMSFSMHVGDSGDRLAQATTMFLTAMAFQFVISSMLPKLAYLTLVDRYILTCNVFISAIVFQVGIVAFVQSHFDFVITTGFDSYLLLANTVVFALIHIFLFVYVQFWVIPLEELKLSSSSSSSRVLRHVGAREPAGTLKISHEKFHTTTTDDNQGVQGAVYFASDQVKGQKVAGVYFSLRWVRQEDINNRRRTAGSTRKYYAVSVATNDTGQDQLLVRRITGDANMPAGRLAARTVSEVPEPGGDPVPGEVQSREDKDDPNGFQWKAARISVIDANTIQVECPEVLAAKISEPDSDGDCRAEWWGDGHGRMIFKRALKDNDGEEEEEKEVVEEDWGGEDAAGEPDDGLDGAAGSDTVEVRAEGHHDGEGQAGGGDDEEAC